MKTVLLTGATGYIGQFAVRHLIDRNYVVHAVSSKPSNLESTETLVWHQANLMDPAETAELVKKVRPTHLLHFAWFVEHGKFWSAPENLDWLRASIHLLQEFVAGGGKRIVMAGTCAEYDWRNPQDRFSELDSPVNPQTLYGVSKHALRLILEKYAFQSNISYAWGRIFFLFGGSEPPDRFVPSITRSLLHGEEAKCSHGNQVRDFMFVEDAAEAFVELLESKVSGPVNIASGSALTLKTIAGMIADIIGRPDLLHFGTITPPADEPSILVADAQRLQDEVGYNAYTDLRSALEKTIDWWKKHS